MAALALAWSCGGDSPTAPPPVPDPLRPTTVTVSPAATELNALGATVQLTAEVRDQNARVMANAGVTWSSGNTSVATVDTSGLVTAAGNGTATITASAGSASGSMVVTVTQMVASVEVSSAEAELTALGATVQLTAEAFDENGHTVTGAEFSWESSDTSVATVDTSGLVTAAGNGTATITASAGSASGSMVVTVTQMVASVEVSPAEAELAALGATVQLTAEAFDENGHTVTGAEFSWESSETSVATVDASGLVTGVAEGMARITASAGETRGSAVVTVMQMVASVEVSPAEAELTALGATVQLTAEAFDENGHTVTGAEFSWEASDTSVATVDASGLVTGVAEGMATITASAGEARGSAVVTVMQTVASVEVSPAEAELTALGATVQLTAEAFDENGHTVTGAEFSWESSDTSVATVDASGLVTGVAEGMATITASAGEARGSAVVTVMQPVASVEVSPAAETVGLGSTLQLTAVGFNENGDTVEGAEFSWESSDTSVATVDVSGLVTGVAEGVATITASAGSGEGMAEITVVDLQKAALVALYETAAGPNWVNSENWLTDAPLGEWFGVDADASGRVVRLDLSGRWDRDAREWIPHGLSGPIPPELGNLTNLRRLDLSQNVLSGPIPPELARLADLQVLRLGGNNLTGPIPPELGEFASLTLLLLYSNRLTGPIPPELARLADLQVLELGNNNLTGPIPPELGELAGLTSLSLYSNRLTGAIPPELARLAELRVLWLRGNDLAGPIPPELGGLANLARLSLSSNSLTGPIPESFLALNALERFRFERNADLCAPGTSDFVTWLEGIEDTSGPYCNESDVEVLNLLYETSGGRDWTNSGGWLETPALDEWYGVTTDALGRVVTLDLTGNGLEGRLPANLGSLAEMTVLRVGSNALSGRLPLSLASLSLVELDYADTGLCAPRYASFQTWLTGLASHKGTGIGCAPLSDREILVSFYEATDGPNWINSRNWLTDAPLGEWYGVDADARGRVVGLSLFANNLGGPIPPELGELTSLAELFLVRNSLTGPILPQLGNLTSLDRMILSENDLAGPLPPELGRLTSLRVLSLGDNELTGPIPSELGRLSRLEGLWLNSNDLSGPIPLELGRLTNLEWVSLSGNNLTGPIPPDLGNLRELRLLDLASNDLSGRLPLGLTEASGLRRLSVANNSGLSGPLPYRLTDLRLESLLAGNTDLCAPPDPGFQAWLETIYHRRIATCAGADRSMAYLTQAVQSREHPVPLVAGEKALLRVFVTTTHPTTAGMPPVRARFYLNGTERHLAEIPATATAIPAEVVERSLSASANAEIPGEVVQPGLEMVIEIDPDGTLDPGLGVAKRIPERGRTPVEVREMPDFDFTVIPFLWIPDPKREVVEMANAMATDPEGHELLWGTRTLLPVGDLEVTVHQPVLSSSNSAYSLLSETRAIAALEGGGGRYMGMMSPPVTGAGGLAEQPGRVSFSRTDALIIAHEFGHNLSLGHAPCGDPAQLDLSYPYPDGSTGVWGYDFRDGGRPMGPDQNDLMSYCGPKWISDYHFTNALRYRLFDERPSRFASLTAQEVESLLLWGGTDAEGRPFLDPAFVVDAPPALPDAGGEHRVTGRTAGGDELFSLEFAMPEVADGDGSSSFAFVLPVQPNWASNLASITLSGPGGSTTLDSDTDLPVTILLDPGTGEVRGILRDVPQADAAAALAPQAGPDTLDVLFSRGIPDAAAWSR